MSFRGLAALAVGLLAVAGSANARADEPLVYRLCQGDVQSVALQEGEAGRFRVVVLLSKTASEAFAVFTGGNIGRSGVVMAGESVLSQAVIRARIDSGRLVGGLVGTQEAKQLQHVLQGQLPRAPCGEVR